MLFVAGTFPAKNDSRLVFAYSKTQKEIRTRAPSRLRPVLLPLPNAVHIAVRRLSVAGPRGETFQRRAPNDGHGSRRRQRLRQERFTQRSPPLRPRQIQTRLGRYVHLLFDLHQDPLLLGQRRLL